MSLQLFTNYSLKAHARREMLNGEEHLVIPVIAAKEGVMNGIFYSANELSNFAQTWNGVPVPVGHPKDAQGRFISANTPEVSNSWNIGHFYNVNFDSTSSSLKGEIWINIAKAEDLGYEGLVAQLEDGEMMNVSTGLFSEAKVEAGTFNANEYVAVATNIRPDHLALLPDEDGACSLADGCGAMRVNHSENSSCGAECKCGGVCKEKPAKRGFFNKLFRLFGNEDSFSDIRDKISAKLRENLTNDSPWPYVMDVYQKSFVYEVSEKLYRQSYTIDGNTQEAVLVGEPTEVKVTRDYVPVIATNNGQQKTSITEIMTNEEKLAKVASIIANSNNGYTQEHHATLMATDDAIIANMEAPKAATAPVVVAPVAPVVNQPQPAAPVQGQLSKEELELVRGLLANTAQNEADKLKKKVVDGYSHLTEDVVANMDLGTVKQLADAIPADAPATPAPQNVASFVGNGAAPASPAPTTNAEQTYTAPSPLLAPPKQA